MQLGFFHYPGFPTFRTGSALQKLETLRLSGTKVSDSGWIDAWKAEQSSPHSEQKCVVQLELNGMGSLLTDSGLSAIVRLFPRLQSLCIARSNVSLF